ncbi:MAG: ECF transporter S component, partial [Cellulomonas sp.]|nr:ECF transporter S component [Cellulomonas sp.]
MTATGGRVAAAPVVPDVLVVPAVPVTLRTALVLALGSVVGVLAFCWPLLIDPDVALASGTDAPIVLAGVLIAVLAVVFVTLGDGGIDVKAIAMLGLLSAVG